MPIARVFHQYGTISHAVVHPSHITLDLPANTPSFTLDGTSVPASVPNLAPLSGLPLHVQPNYFDIDHFCAETLVTKHQFIQDYQTLYSNST